MNTAMRFAIAFALMNSGPACADDSAERGASKAAVCTGCHGPQGISVNPLWPNLAGQHIDYLVKQMKAFRDGSRAEPTMQPFVATLKDDDLADIAAFFASRKSCQSN
jgi:cytochrome c553